MKIAVIDDEAGIRGLIRTVLEMQGHDIFEADNGVTGLDLARKIVPDLIICDIRMPEMTGDELFEILREDASDTDFAVIPFIFLSGDANEAEQIKRLNKGADHCFEKPVDMQLLAAHVNSLLSRAGRVSDFIKRKLDHIAAALPQTIEHDFSGYKSLTANTRGYVSIIVDVMRRCAGENKSSDTHVHMLEDELNYIRYCLNRFEGRKCLVRTVNGEDLSWTLIFMVVQAQLEELKIYVSDLYVSIPSAKSTINARISSLIEDDVLTKSGDENDGRRQQLLLTERFKQELMDHIDTSINMIRKMA